MLDRRQFHQLACGFGAAALGLPASAQTGDFPSRPIKIIVPYAAGGGPDVLTRHMAAKLAEVLGKDSNIIVENIVGAGGILAAQSAARMAPDGYSLLVGSSSHVVQKAMKPSAQFDPLKDFAHIVRTTYTPSILVVAQDAPYRTLDDIVKAATKEPGKLNYASGGVGSAAHLCGAALALQAKIDVVHVPYKGSVEIVPSILNGATHFGFPIASTAIPLIKAGKVRPLAIASAQRMPAFPDVPTLVELFKAPDLALDPWFGLWAPAGTPKALVDLLAGAVTRTYEDPKVRASSEAAGATIALSASPGDFTRFIEAETVKWERIVKAAHLTVN